MEKTRQAIIKAMLSVENLKGCLHWPKSSKYISDKCRCTLLHQSIQTNTILVVHLNLPIRSIHIDYVLLWWMDLVSACRHLAGKKWYFYGIWYMYMESESDVAFGLYSSKMKVIFRRNRYITWNEGCYYYFPSGISSGMFINPGGPGRPSNHPASKPWSFGVFYCL